MSPPPSDAPPGAPAADPPRRAALAFIFVTVMLDMLAVGIVVPVLPLLIKEFLDGDVARTAQMLGVFGTVWALMQFVFMPVLGALSDAHGRRKVVLLSNFGLGLDYFIMALAPSLGFLFAGRVISGITAASVTTASAYIADVTPPERRAAGFGMLGAAFGVGFVIGPALGGVLGGVSPRLPFWVAAALSLANGLYGVFVLPESLPPGRRAPFRWRNAGPRGALRILGSRPGLLGLATVQFLSNLAHVVLPSTAVLYTGYRYGWGPRQVGWMLALVGGSSMLVQMGLVRSIVGRYGERRSLVGGLLCGGLSFGIYGLAPTGALFLVGVPLMALCGVSGAAGQSLMSRAVGPSEQGRLQGALSAVQGIAGMLAPSLFAFTFARFIGPWRSVNLPGAPFLVAASLIFLAVGVAAAVMRVKLAPPRSLPV